MKARHFDEAFDAGEDVSDEIDWEKARRPNLALKRVNVDFPVWVIEALDREARGLGVSQALDRRTARPRGVSTALDVEHVALRQNRHREERSDAAIQGS